MSNPKKKLVVKLKKTRKPQGVSPELVGMLRKLADWNPKSDAAVLEAANRLAQAAREKLTPDLFKEKAADSRTALAICSKLKGHTLSRYNGIGEDHHYVVSASCHDKERKVIELSTIYLFRRNRIGEWSVGLRTLHVDAGEVTADRSVVTYGKRHDNTCPLPGYKMDSEDAAEAMDAVKDVVGVFNRAFGAHKQTKPSTR